MHGHAFNPTQDLRNLQNFLAELRHDVGQAAALHYGDLLWRMRNPANRFDPSTDLRVWTQPDGMIDGFVFHLVCEDNPEFMLRPSHYESEIATEMVAWARLRSKQAGATIMETSCVAGDIEKEKFLRRHGFTHFDDVYVFMGRSLAAPIPAAQPPDHYAIVSHDECRIPSVTGTEMTAPEYANICAMPGYRDDLGLRVCYREREIVAGCICWFDDIAGSALFEPVGTVASHRGKGLAFAAMTQTLTNLRRTGARHVYVKTHKENVPAIRLYEKLGFAILAEDNGWRLVV